MLSPPTGGQVLKAIQYPKNGKALGVDLITAEMLKADVWTAANVLNPLLKNSWLAEEVPKD